MRATDLKEAQEIVTAIAWLNSALTQTEVESGTLRLKRTSTGSNDRSPTTDFALSIAARKAALKVMRDEWEARIMQHRRRAAQLDLSL